MSSYWQILPDPAHEDEYELHAEAVFLPGIKCGACGNSWAAMSRSAITALDDSTKAMLKRLPGSCDVKTWRELAETIRHLLPRNRANDPIKPGMQVGRKRIKRYKKCGCDFVWTGPWDCYLQQTCVGVVRDACNSLVSFEPCEPVAMGLVEIIPIHISVREFGQQVLCDVCGLSNTDRVDAAAALDDFVRRSGVRGFLAQMPGMMVVDDPLRKRVEELKMTNVLFREL